MCEYIDQTIESGVVEEQTTDNIILHDELPATLAAPPFLGAHEPVGGGGVAADTAPWNRIRQRDTACP